MSQRLTLGKKGVTAGDVILGLKNTTWYYFIRLCILEDGRAGHHSLPTCGFLFEGPVPENLIGLGLVLLLEHSSELFQKSEETCTHCLVVAPFSFLFDLQCSHMGGCVCRLSIYTDQ